MKRFLFTMILFLFAMPLYGQFISVNLDKSSESVLTEAYRSAATNEIRGLTN